MRFSVPHALHVMIRQSECEAAGSTLYPMAGQESIAQAAVVSEGG